MSRPRALITGITGQDGSYLAELLLEKDYEVVGLMRGDPASRPRNLEAVRGQVRLVQGDLLDPLVLVEALSSLQPTEIYNLAGTSFVPASWRQPVMTAQFSAVGVTSMLEAVRVVSPAVRVYQASSSEIFGAASEHPQHEGSACRPQTPYGVAKLYGHGMVAAYRHRYGLHASSGIAYNHESPRRPDEFVTRKVTRGAAMIKLGLASELKLGDLSATRDWSAAQDVVRAMWLMLQQEEAGEYVICSGISRPVKELVDTAFGCLDLDPEQFVRVDPKLVRPPEAFKLVGDPSKARRALGWSPEIAFEDMVAGMVEHDLKSLQAHSGQRS